MYEGFEKMGMTTESDDNEVDSDFINTLAGEVLSVFRINLIILTLFLTVLGLLTREASMEYVLQVAGSSYTNVGLQLLLGSMLASALLYFRIRQIGTEMVYSDKGVLNDEKILSYSVAASVIGSAMGVVSLFVGALDGLGEGGIPINQMVVVLIPIWLISTIFVILTLPDMAVRGRQRAREWWADRNSE